MPTEVPGVAFLSGGQSEVEATKNLNEINKINDTSFHFTFSYGRALQQSALKTWAKSMKDIAKIQKVFDHRAKMNGASITAANIALRLAVRRLIAIGECLPKEQRLTRDEIRKGANKETLSQKEKDSHEMSVMPNDVAAISVGMVDGQVWTFKKN